MLIQNILIDLLLEKISSNIYMQVLPPQQCAILYDCKLSAIISIFTSEDLCDTAMKQLIKEDYAQIKDMIEKSIINGTYEPNETALLQAVNWVMNGRSNNLLSTMIEYRGYCPIQRYRKYLKNLNDFDINYKHNTRVIILPEKI
jgi:hypothetical protein